MEYEEIELIKQSEKSTVHLVRDREGIYVRKILKGRHQIYHLLQDSPHPCLPKLYQVTVGEDTTTVLEEYIKGQTCGSAELSGKQLSSVVRQLCSVLIFLHGKGIIHRDVKPSNILLTEEGRLYLTDFDAARILKEEQEQDTRLLGTRGFAPPEEYGFSQTDERTDIYALGATLRQILGEKAHKRRYRKIIRKCMNLDPDRRYQSVRQVRQAFFHTKQDVLYVLGILFCIGSVMGGMLLSVRWEEGQTGSGEQESTLAVLPSPENPHWDGETGTATWGNVPESGIGGEVQFWCRLYRRDSPVPPSPEDDDWYHEEKVRIGGPVVREMETHSWNLASVFEENGFYYFSIAAVGDGFQYADSSYVISDVFEYTGEFAPPLPTPVGLMWKEFEIDDTRQYFAVWSNLDEYEDKDTFNVTLYDQTGAYVMNNTWSKEIIREQGYGGIKVNAHFLVSGVDQAYRFTVQVYSSRPNEYRSSPMPDPPTEEYYSPWLIYGAQSDKQ